MEVSVTHKTEVVSGREYPLTITRQRGLQEIEVQGEMILVESVTIFDGPLGRSLCFTRARPDMTLEGWEAVCRRTREIATKAMIEQGIW